MVMVKAVIQQKDGREIEYFLREGQATCVDEYYYWSRTQAKVFDDMKIATLAVNSEQRLFDERYGHIKAIAFIEVGK